VRASPSLRAPRAAKGSCPSNRRGAHGDSGGPACVSHSPADRNARTSVIGMSAVVTPWRALYMRAGSNIERLCRDRSFWVDDLARELFVSRRTLERCFADCGTTVASEIRASRVAWATTALRLAPYLEFARLARRVGFRSQSRMGEAFRRELECTPGDFRRAVLVENDGRWQPQTTYTADDWCRAVMLLIHHPDLERRSQLETMTTDLVRSGLAEPFALASRRSSPLTER
jgi:AraC-like DNA-binding protein